MKTFFIRNLVLAGVVLAVGWAHAGPSELNYQGVLLDGSGNGVTGTRAMTLKLYDAAIGGNLLYTEDLGNVSVNKGVYSFNFGTNGTGNPKVTETVTVADGTNSTFQKILANTNVVSGSVSVTDGTYSWDQINGPSDGGVNFDASYSTALRRITVNYYNGAPPAGRIVRVTYRSPSAGLAGILTNENDPWLEVAVNGVTQSPRQKLLAVPFAIRAAGVEGATFQETAEVDLPIKRFNLKNYVNSNVYNDFNSPLPISAGDRNYGANYELIFDIPFFVKEIISITVNYSVTRFDWGGVPYFGRIDVTFQDSRNQVLQSSSFPRSVTNSAIRVIPVGRSIPASEQFRISITLKPGNDGYDGYGGYSLNSVMVRAKVLKSMGLQ